MEPEPNDEQELEEIMSSRENSAESSPMHGFAPVDFDYPVQIGVRLYIEIKKSELDFGMYALIITREDKSASEKLFDDKVGVVMCLEYPSEKVVELIAYKSKVSAPMLLFDMKGNKIITNSKNSKVKVRQIYKDKCTLISVMAKYAIEHSFNFYAKRSGKKMNDDAMIFGSHIGLKAFSGG
ncbi:hypothetical protein FXO38_01877 [Capsicum annuum]|nr:hypothetical protein FXO38_01877 [Capsicum annuum]